jgi:hypothetical protein
MSFFVVGNGGEAERRIRHPGRGGGEGQASAQAQGQAREYNRDEGTLSNNIFLLHFIAEEALHVFCSVLRNWIRDPERFFPDLPPIFHHISGDSATIFWVKNTKYFHFFVNWLNFQYCEICGYTKKVQEISISSSFFVLLDLD